MNIEHLMENGKLTFFMILFIVARERKPANKEVGLYPIESGNNLLFFLIERHLWTVPGNQGVDCRSNYVRIYTKFLAYHLVRPNLLLPCVISP